MFSDGHTFCLTRRSRRHCYWHVIRVDVYTRGTSRNSRFSTPDTLSESQSPICRKDNMDRFKKNPDNTVSDLRTGLIWMADSDKVLGDESLVTWNKAFEVCARLRYAGTGWRLPTLSEMLSLFRKDSTGEWTMATSLIVIHLDDYWTSTEFTYSRARTVSLAQGYGYASCVMSKERVLPVRTSHW